MFAKGLWCTYEADLQESKLPAPGGASVHLKVSTVDSVEKLPSVEATSKATMKIKDKTSVNP